MWFSLCYIFGTIAIGALSYWLNRCYRKAFVSDFNGKYVFITGTDSGFGYKLAVDLDKLGLHVYAGCYSEEGAVNLKEKTSSNLKTIRLDVTDQTSVDNAKTFIENDLPIGEKLWGLVNNAGIGGNTNSILAKMEDYRQTMEVNFFGSIRVTEAFQPLIIKSKGRIIQVISVAGRVCAAASAAYTCSKFALEPFADELRRNMKQFGVKVCSIEPSFFNQTLIFKNSQYKYIMTQRFKELPDWKKKHFGYDYVEREFERADALWSNRIPLFSKVNTCLDVVTEAMTHGLGAKRPKSRYVVGTGSRLYVLLAGFSPDWLLDYFLSSVHSGERKTKPIKPC